MKAYGLGWLRSCLTVFFKHVLQMQK
jgi:hypothetical protein